jgi:regulator of replication initiation timing
MAKLTIPEYCRKFAVAESTVRYQVRTGKLQSELIDEQIHVIIDDSEIDAIDSKVGANDELIAELRQQVEYLKAENGQLREELSKERQRADEAQNRHDTIIQQMQQDTADAQQRSDTIILQLTRQFEQQTQLLEDIRPKEEQKKSFFKRLFKKD